MVLNTRGAGLTSIKQNFQIYYKSLKNPQKSCNKQLFAIKNFNGMTFNPLQDLLIAHVDFSVYLLSSQTVLNTIDSALKICF